MSVFKLQIGSRFDISVETIQRGVTLPQYIRSKVESGEVCVLLKIGVSRKIAICM